MQRTADDLEQLAAALRELARRSEEDPQFLAIAEQIAEASPLAIAQAGLATFRDVSRSFRVWRVVTSALDRLDDVQPIVDAVLRVWRDAAELGWQIDLDVSEVTRAALVGIAEIEAQLRADLAASVDGADEAIVHRRAEQAARWLGHAGTPTALAALVRAARTLRMRTVSPDQSQYTLPGVYVGLARSGVAAAVPTLLLAFDTDRLRSHHAQMLAPLAGLAPDRVRPLLQRLALAGEELSDVTPALATVRDIETLRAMCAFPEARARERARETLQALGEEPPPAAAMPAPETLVTHPSAAVREAALRALAQTSDPALATSIVAVHVLESEIARRFGGTAGSYRRYFDVLPAHLRQAPHDKQLVELRAGRVRGLPEQVIWPAVQPILDGRADELALSYPSPELRIDFALAETLRDEEAAILATLEAGTIPASAASGPPIAFASSAPAPTPAAPIGTAAPDLSLIDALLDALAHEQAPPPDVVAAARLRPDIASLDRWERARALCAALLKLGARDVGERLLARIRELHGGAMLVELADAVFPYVARSPDGAHRLAEAWDEAFTLPWDSPYRADDLFKSVAGVDEVFTRARDEIAAPDNGALSRRTSAAFEILKNAGRVEEVVPIVVARIRADRGRPRPIIGWRGDAYRTLRKTAGPSAVATAALELAELDAVDRGSPLVEILAHSAQGHELLAQAIDLPGLATDAARALLEATRYNEQIRVRYLAHPYWRVRLIAADANGNYDRGRADRYATWAAIDAAKLRVPDDDRRYARPSEASPNTTWDDLARPLGGRSAVPPLSPAVDGMIARCADYRAWALESVDGDLDPAHVVARVLADEVDAELVAFGHLRHAARWAPWRARVPDLPHDRRLRLRWALERSAELPASYAELRERGPRAFAADLPRPHLVLSPALRDALEAEEAKLAAIGDRLLRGETVER